MKRLMSVCVLLSSVAYLAGAQEVTEKQIAESSYNLVANEGDSQARWYVSPGVGIMILDGPTDNEPVFFRFSVGYDLTDYFSLEAGMMYAPAHDAAPGVKGGQSAGPTLDALFHLLGKEGGRWDPYLTAGLAYWFANGDLFNEHHREVLVPRVGAGLAYHLTDDLSLRLEGKTGFPFKSTHIDESWITTVELGLLYRFGGSKAVSERPPLPVVSVPVSDAIKENTPPDADDWMRYELYINFDYDQANIKSEYNPGLNEIARVIKKAFAVNPDATVSVEGHADRRHKSVAAYNQNLSERRALAVKSYLVNTGVDASKVRTIGFGFTKPKVPINLDLGNPENRRVDLFIHGVGDAASRAKLRQMD